MRTIVPLDRAMFSLLGHTISGDLGDMTIWRTRRGRIVSYPRTVPGTVPSPPQQNHRAHFRESAARWKLLPAQARADYEAVSLRLSLPMTGYNIWIRWTFAGSKREAQTLMHQTGITLSLPPELS